MIQRKLYDRIKNQLFKGKAIILIGSRQTGKTSLLQQLFENNPDVLWLNGDDIGVQGMVSNINTEQWRMLLSNKKVLVIDEAQQIPEIGLRMKLVTDQLKEVQLIASGSSSFELANRLNEPLTGRKVEYKLYPLSYAEMAGHHGLLAEHSLIGHRLVYGYYPEVVTSPGNEKEVLRMLTDSYLYKDVLIFGGIKKSDKIISLLQALAFKVGSQVSYSELSATVGIDGKTVESYIDILEKSYIVFRLPSFSRNLRNELKHSRKIYFYDNGVRNALISNFAPVGQRTDTGALWENFVVSERVKCNEYNRRWCNSYFWRTHKQKEIDYIEECDGRLYAYEFKYNPRKAAVEPKDFAEAYPDALFKEITPSNIEEFILN
ncbi:MAG: ATP-binding protein [Bacteroidales bacterium]|nr:ATP-binding protein [Bacteroidales bacterium]